MTVATTTEAFASLRNLKNAAAKFLAANPAATAIAYNLRISHVETMEIWVDRNGDAWDHNPADSSTKRRPA